MKHNYEIRYKNVYLRPLFEKDIESLRNWRNNPHNTLYLNRIPYITPGMQKVWFDNYILNDDEMFFAIVEDIELHRLVGSLSLYHFSKNNCFFGKILIGDIDAHGRNIGLNATNAALKIAFEQLGMKKVDLYVYADNFAALKIYQKAGFIIRDNHFDANGRIEYIMTKCCEGDK